MRLVINSTFSVDVASLSRFRRDVEVETWNRTSSTASFRVQIASTKKLSCVSETVTSLFRFVLLPFCVSKLISKLIHNQSNTTLKLLPILTVQMTEVDRMVHVGSAAAGPFPSSLTSDPVDDSSRPAEVFGSVHSLESFSTVDGPGIRYMVFTQGCPCRCLFCCNPDTWDPANGERMSSREIAEKMRRTLPFMKSSGGGITVSGGEALLQPEFVSALFQEAHEMGVDTCLDTTGQGCLAEKLEEVLPHTDLALVCIKHIRREMYKKITRRRIDPMLRFLAELNKREIPFWIRYVLIPGLTMDPSDVDLLCDYCSKQPFIKGLELLPYHTLGVEKWKQMGLEYPLTDVVPPSRVDVEKIIRQVESYGLTVKCDLSTARQVSS